MEIYSVFSVCIGEIDVIFVVDSSGSIDKADFELAKDFVKDVVSLLDISPSTIRVGYVNFASSTVVEFDLTTYNNKNDVLNAISAVVQIGNGTDTDEGIDAMQKIFDNLGRPGVQHVGIVMTDGRANSNSKLTVAVNNAKQQGTRFVSIGVGTAVSTAQLQLIASSPTDVYEVDDYATLANIISNIAYEICGKY